MTIATSTKQNKTAKHEEDKEEEKSFAADYNLYYCSNSTCAYVCGIKLTS